MKLSPFNAFYIARKLEYISADENFIPVFSSSDIKIYPFQIAAAHFALRSPYQKGVILCDESGMGKSHEAMLILAQKYFEGKNKILIAIPNADLLVQWEELLKKHYSIPFVNAELRIKNPELQNPFDGDGVIIATYDFLSSHESLANSIPWDITVFEEATALCNVYQAESKTAKILKTIAENSFKILLTGTPIEKNIMDLYGLLYFIDESILEPEQEFLHKYLRKPANYPELSERVSKYAFRTLRSQAKQYAKITNRIPITYEYTLTEKEQLLYDKLFTYCNKQNKLAFPDMSAYDLSLKLLGLQGSSTAAILHTLKNIELRLQSLENTQSEQYQQEIIEIQQMISVTSEIKTDAKLIALQNALKAIFKICKNSGAKQKILIFTESAQTQKYLYNSLKDSYKTTIYNGSSTYAVIADFKTNGEILISTDIGARGFNLEECSVVVQYDLLYNTLKMEQRIDRIHRIGQENDIIVLSFIDKHNFADVRKLELVNKRTLVADGVLGISDYVLGGFTDNLEEKLKEILHTARSKNAVEFDYQNSLIINEDSNKDIVHKAEEKLFTTFTKELRDKVKISPQYIEQESEKANDNLWELAKYFFMQYNENNSDCTYIVDENNKTITAENYTKLPTLFYYFNGSQNKKYGSQKQYGIAKDFKPNSGKLALASIVGKGILHEMACAPRGSILIENAELRMQNCTIALYSVTASSGKTEPLLVGITDDGTVLSHKECENILSLDIISYTEDGHKSPAWLKTKHTFNKLDALINTDEITNRLQDNLSEAQKEEVERIKLAQSVAKSNIEHEIAAIKNDIAKLEKQLQSESGNRMEILKVEKDKSAKVLQLKKKQDKQFFEQMQAELETEKKIIDFLGSEKVTINVVRQFVVEVEISNNKS